LYQCRPTYVVRMDVQGSNCIIARGEWYAKMETYCCRLVSKPTAVVSTKMLYMLVCWYAGAVTPDLPCSGQYLPPVLCAS
jgi:hypothetical protein